MKKLLIIIILAMITIFLSITGNSINLFNINEHDINILKQNDKILIEENIKFQANTNESNKQIIFWISELAQEIQFKFFENEIAFSYLENNNYSVNISSYNLSNNSILNLNINYYIEEDYTEFKKITTYDTNKLSIQFNDENIFEANHLSHKSEILISLYTPTEAPISIYIFISIFLILLLILIVTYYIFTNQKKSKIKNITGESKELLSTKKLLLMSILKQLEKEYRAKKISDDTYNKLRDLYKQEAVESMKKLEDIESEII